MRMYEGKVTFAVVGLGGRASAYLAALREFYPDGHAVVAVADPDPKKRLRAAQEYAVPESGLFETDLELMEQPRLADVAIVGTQDALHYRETVALLEKGYDIILEKPISTKMDELLDLRRRAAAYPNQMVAVCHVLRHTAFFSRIRQIIESGKLGRVVTIQHNENIGYYHFAHSYVRGPWKCADTSGPLAITKSCHDMDILLWLSGQRCTRVSSFGSLHHFDAAHAPQDAPLRCTDGCPHSVVCPYDAGKIYLTDNVGWPTEMLTTDLSREGRLKALREGPYGRCVYHCDNDVVDRQVVNLEFDNGAVASFTMTAFTTDMARQLKVCGTKGQITADMNANTVSLHRFGESGPREITLETPPQTNNYGHGGGDYYLMRDFVRAIQSGGDGNLSSARVSLQSHLICFAAERSRVERRIVEL